MTKEGALLVVFDPPFPRELVEVAVVTDYNEPNGHYMDAVPAAGLLGAVRTIECGVAGILRPIARLAKDVALWALKPAWEANTDKFTGAVAIHAGRYLGSNGRQSEAIHTKLLLEPRLVNRLWVPQPRRWSPAVPFFEAGCNGRDAGLRRSHPRGSR